MDRIPLYLRSNSKRVSSEPAQAELEAETKTRMLNLRKRLSSAMPFLQLWKTQRVAEQTTMELQQIDAAILESTEAQATAVLDSGALERFEE